MEKEEFKKWLKKDPANRLFFEELELRWQEEPHKDAGDPNYLFDYENGLHRLREKLDNAKSKKVIKVKALSTGRRLPLGWKVAASILFVIIAVSVFAVSHFSTPPVAPVISYATSNAEQQTINLPDGSKVRLNKNSKISFVKGFSGSVREITLSGEAFFQVKHNDDKPFIIHAGDGVLRDIGTSFNVKEEKGGNIVVAVKNGIVSLRNDKMDKKQAIILQKNQVGILKKGNITTIKSGGIQNYLSWISGQIVFKRVPFDQVIRQLDHIYGIQCQLADSSLSALKLTAYIKNTSLNDVLHMISLSLNIKYQKKENRIIWMQKDKNDLQLQSHKQESVN